MRTGAARELLPQELAEQSSDQWEGDQGSYTVSLNEEQVCSSPGARRKGSHAPRQTQQQKIQEKQWIPGNTLLFFRKSVERNADWEIALCYSGTEARHTRANYSSSVHEEAASS